MAEEKIKLGESATIILPGGEEEETYQEVEEVNNKVLPSEDETTRYLRRGNPLITFYDLGTRLSIVPPATDFSNYTRRRAAATTSSPVSTEGYYAEYLEMTFDALATNPGRYNVDQSNMYDVYSFSPDSINADIPHATQLEWDKRCLGSRSVNTEGESDSSDTMDPLGYTKEYHSERRLAHCLPIWYGPDSQSTTVEPDVSGNYNSDQLFDLIIYKDAETHTLPNSTWRESVRDIREGNDDSDPTWPTQIRNEQWKKRTSRPKDALELWNPRIKTQKDDYSNGYLDMKTLQKSWNIKIDSRLCYESFDTGDTATYKITRLANYNAEEVENVTFSPSKGIRIFLKPMWVCWIDGKYYYEWKRGFEFETYRWRDWTEDAPYNEPDGTGTWTDRYDHPALANDTGSGPFAFWSNKYHADASVDNWPETLVIVNTAGSLTANGQPVTAGVKYYDIVPGMELVFHPNISGTHTYEVVPNWRIYDDFNANKARVTASLRLGPAAGRLPAYPRPYYSGWDSQITYNGDSSYTVTDEEYGVTSTYDVAVAATKQGRHLAISWFSSPAMTVAQKAQVVDRKIYLYDKVYHYAVEHLQPYTIYWMDHPFTDAELLAAKQTAFPSDGHTPIGSLTTTYNPYAETEASQFETWMGTHDHVRNFAWATGDPGVGGVWEASSPYTSMFPPRTSPAGTLCGIIEVGTVPYYVWRRVQKSYPSHDSDRDNAGGRFRS